MSKILREHWIIFSSILIIITSVVVSLCLYHNHITNLTERHIENISAKIDDMHSSLSKSKHSIKLITTELKASDEHQKFLENYYNTQNNWLNFWLAIIGAMMLIVTVVTPLVYIRKIDIEQEKLKNILEDLNIEKKINDMNLEIQKSITMSMNNIKEQEEETIRQFEKRIDKIKLEHSSDNEDLLREILGIVSEDIKDGYLGDDIRDIVVTALNDIREEEERERYD